MKIQKFCTIKTTMPLMLYCFTKKKQAVFKLSSIKLKKDKIKINPDHRAQSDYNWREHILEEAHYNKKKSLNLRRTFGSITTGDV